MRSMWIRTVLAILVLQGWAASAGAVADIIRVITPVGIEVWYVREPSLPIIATTVLFKNAGSASEPPDKLGLAFLASITLNEGAGDLDSFAFLSRVDELALDLDFDANTDTFGVEMRTLSENRDEAFHLLGLSLTEPRFDADPVGRMREAHMVNLSQREEDSEIIVGDQWLLMAFPDHPYSHPSRGRTVTASTLTSDDLREFVRTRFTRDRLIVGAVGDVPPEEIARLVDLALAALPATGPSFEVPDIELAMEDRIEILRLPTQQAQVLMGARGIAREDPDYYAASLLNTVLGGASFLSRIWKEAREERGLVYAIGTYNTPLEHAAYYMASFSTANENVTEAIDVVRTEVERVVRDGLTEEELANAKTYSIGSFALRLTRSTRIANTLVGMQFSGLPIDYLDTRSDLINAVTLDHVNRVARRMFLGDEDADPATTPVDFLISITGDPPDLANKPG